MCIRDRLNLADSDDSDEAEEEEEEEEPEKYSGDRETDRVIREGTTLKEEGTTLFKQQKWSAAICKYNEAFEAVSYTHLRAHETVLDLVCRLLLEKKKKNKENQQEL
eukprot:TRINITY_DN2875_c0_g2_i1.p2 TRINITY_DN2875_c0_g2~~TRINITY_DN2875_c0_g2_i1.p2  ORF type:complete len:107 (-),score=46.08 TRINITY_DN2875_c0_g2_i1:6-326(-)